MAKSRRIPTGAQPQRAIPDAPVIRLPMWRFGTMFCVCVLIGFGLLMATWVKPAVALFTRALVTISAALINIAGGGASASDDVMQSQVTGFAVRMENGCNGVHVMIVLWSAMLAFPASPIQKIKGLLAGGLLIHGVNLVRFISLFFLGQYAPAWFDFAHFYFWESMIMLDSLVIFWVWSQSVFRSAAISNAST